MSVLSCRCQPSISPDYSISCVQSRFVQTRSVENGRVVFKSDFHKVNLGIEDKDFKSSDFSIDSIIAVGAVNQLKEVTFNGDGNIDTIVSSVQNLQNSIQHG